MAPQAVEIMAGYHELGRLLLEPSWWPETKSIVKSLSVVISPSICHWINITLRVRRLMESVHSGRVLTHRWGKKLVSVRTCRIEKSEAAERVRHTTYLVEAGVHTTYCNPNSSNTKPCLQPIKADYQEVWEQELGALRSKPPACGVQVTPSPSSSPLRILLPPIDSIHHYRLRDFPCFIHVLHCLWLWETWTEHIIPLSAGCNRLGSSNRTPTGRNFLCLLQTSPHQLREIWDKHQK